MINQASHFRTCDIVAKESFNLDSSTYMRKQEGIKMKMLKM